MNSDTMVWTVLALLLFKPIVIVAAIGAAELFLAMVPFTPHDGEEF